MMRLVKQLIAFGIFVVVFLVGGCLPGQQNGGQGKQTITVYGFSIMKEALEKEIYPAFAAKWKQEKGVEINFVSSFAGSETVTNQILQGAPADIAILSIERDATRLSQGQAVTSDWRLSPNHGIVNKTPFVILVREGNPKQIADFPDLAKDGVRVIHPDPVSSGGAQWSILAVYGSELVKSQAATGSQDANKALETLKAVWKNVISTPGSAREARTQFETGYGDALITYELEGLLMKQAGADVDVIIPKATIFSEHPAVVIDRNVTPEERPAVQAFLNYLWTDDAQKAFVKYHFRSVTNESFNDANPEFAKIQQPFAIDLFGGWDHAYPEVIDQIFLKQVQSK
ncbi:MAG TPA: sulfate ABC transporter substrate-binding protein [Pyrinomonadaceae bacterium]|nr:sulfate ABC transporter substrate-binding protein [Pyrinomonadaceae bacterium]